MKLYLAGPTKGIKDFNYDAFFEAAAYLRGLGHEVFNPAEESIKQFGDGVNISPTGDPKDAEAKGFKLRIAMARNLFWISMHAEGIALLPGWQKSKGATAEHAAANCLHLKVVLKHDFGWHELRKRTRKPKDAPIEAKI